MSSYNDLEQMKLGTGWLPTVFGKHVIKGTLAAHSVDTSGTDKQVTLKVLLGVNTGGGWNAIELLTYDGVTIPEDNWEFFPGDANPATDSRFPSQIKHGNIARYSANLPAGITSDDQPDKMAAIIRCQKMNTYDSSGSITSANHYTVNPADEFAELIRVDSVRKGLTFADRIDWENYAEAWTWFNESLTFPNYSLIPKNFRISRSAGGTWTTGTYAISIQAYNGDGDFSQRTGEASITLSGGNKVLNVNGDAVDGATGYRIWVRNTSGSTYVYADTLDPNVSLSANPSNSGTPADASGAFLSEGPRMQSHVAFTQPTSLDEALNAICLQAGCDWQKAGEKYRILLPIEREAVHHFDESNTIPGSFRYYRKEVKDLYNRIECNFREITDPFLRPAQPLMVNREDSQAAVGLRPEAVNLWTMSRHQAMRVMSLRMKQNHDRNLWCEADDDGDGAHLLPGDVVTFSDSGAEWDHKMFVIVEIQIGETETAGKRHYICREWSNDDYQDSDGDNLPVTTTVPSDAPSRFTAPLNVGAMILSTDYAVLNDGTTNGFIVGSVTFRPHVTPVIGRLYQKKPGAGDFSMIQTLSPDPATGSAGFRVEMAEEGTHTFKVVVVSVIGVEQTDTPDEYTVDMPLYLIAPSRPTGLSVRRDSNVLRWTIGSAPSRNLKSYRVTDGSGVFVADSLTSEWVEPVPAGSSVTRRFYSVDSSGNVSSNYQTATWNAEYTDQRVVGNVPWGSSNFQPSGDDSGVSSEDAEYLNGTGGSLNSDSRIWTKSGANNTWNAGVIFSRAPAFGDCRVDFTVPFANNSSADEILIGLTYKGDTVPSALADVRYGLNPQTSALSGGSARFRVIEGGSVVTTIATTWTQGDVVSVVIESGTVKYYKNSTLLYTSLVSPVYPLTPCAMAYKQNQTIYEGNFKLTGWLQDTTPAKPHWRNVVGAMLNTSDNLARTAASTGWNQAGAFSLESFLGSGYVEFNHSGGGTNKAYVVGLSTTDPDQDYTSMPFCVMAGTSDLLGTANQGFYIIESGSFVFTYSNASLTTSDKIRIAIENGSVVYRLNGVVVYTSAHSPTAGARYYVDTAIYASGSPVLNVRTGDIGSRGRGWRIGETGEAEFAKGVTVGGSRIDSVRARSIGAITPDNKYRGNDFGPPLESRLTASMFSLGTLRTFEADIYTELIINIPESVLDDTYTNFDSVKLARVKVYNLFGEVVTSCEQAFGGRGKFVVGMHTRDYADPLEQAVFSVEFKNIYGWSRPVFWTNAAVSGGAWGSSGVTSDYTSNNGSITPPVWSSRAKMAAKAVGVAVDHKSVQISWTPAAVTDSSQNVWGRVHQKGVVRPAWNVAVSSLGGSVATSTVTGISGVPLAPNTEYEFMIGGDANFEWSNIVYVRTQPQPPAALPTREAPSGLAVSIDSSSQVTLTWTRNASANNNVEVYKDGSLSSTESAATVSKTITSLTPGQSYRFAVRNKWSSGTTYSDFSNEVQVTMPSLALPTANDPSNLTLVVTGLGNSVRLSWSKNSGNLAEVQRSLDDGANWTSVTTLGSNVVTYTDVAIGYDTHVYYRVRNTSGGNTGFSNVADIWTNPDVTNDPDCVTPETDVLTVTNSGKWLWRKAGSLIAGDTVITGSGQQSKIVDVVDGKATSLRVITLDTGMNIHCSPSHPILTPSAMEAGTPAHQLRVGDDVMVFDIGSRSGMRPARIIDIEVLRNARGDGARGGRGGKPFSVITFRLESGEHTFVTNGIVSHNLSYKRY